MGRKQSGGESGMPIRVLWTCDQCGNTATSHNRRSTPRGWIAAGPQTIVDVKDLAFCNQAHARTYFTEHPEDKEHRDHLSHLF